MRHRSQDGLLDTFTHRDVRAFVAAGFPGLTSIEVILAIGALEYLRSGFALFDTEPLGGGLVGFYLWHING